MCTTRTSAFVDEPLSCRPLFPAVTIGQPDRSYSSFNSWRCTLSPLLAGCLLVFSSSSRRFSEERISATGCARARVYCASLYRKRFIILVIPSVDASIAFYSFERIHYRIRSLSSPVRALRVPFFPRSHDKKASGKLSLVNFDRGSAHTSSPTRPELVNARVSYDNDVTRLCELSQGETVTRKSFNGSSRVALKTRLLPCLGTLASSDRVSRKLIIIISL